MSDGQFTVYGNYIKESAIGPGASVNFFERTSPPTESEYKQIIFALKGLKCSLDESSAEYCKLTKIEECAKKRDSRGMRFAAIEFAKQFSSAALANMFSGSVLHLLGL